MVIPRTTLYKALLERFGKEETREILAEMGRKSIVITDCRQSDAPKAMDEWKIAPSPAPARRELFYKLAFWVVLVGVLATAVVIHYFRK
jgi:hypothetical protein